MQEHLRACRSAPHRAVLGLLPPAIGLPARDGLSEDLSASSADGLLRAASTGKSQIITMLSSAFENAPKLMDHIPPYLFDFLVEMSKANIDRNRKILDHLERIGSLASQRGITVVALKGAAELLAPTWQDPRKRYLSDVDLLVPEVDRARTMVLLAELGGTAKDTLPDLHHEAQVVMSPDAFIVEVHWRVASNPVFEVLPAENVFDTMIKTDLKGICVPTLLQRSIHQLFHDIFQERLFWRRFNIEPRSLVDHHVRWLRLSDFERAEVEDTLLKVSTGVQFRAFQALDGLIFEGEFPKCSRSARNWTSTKLSRFGEETRSDLQQAADSLIDVAQGFLFDYERRVRYTRYLGDKRAWRRFLRHVSSGTSRP